MAGYAGLIVTDYESTSPECPVLDYRGLVRG